MTKNTIGQFIAALRKANGLTQQDVADRLNVSNKAVSRWERDECAPDLSVIPALAEMFGVTCDELLKGERISESASPERKEPKVDKQVKALINRSLSGFKTLICIALAIACVGIICMFGISYGFYRPVIGFAVMMLFEVCAFALAALAVSKARDIKEYNELFELADPSLKTKFNRTFSSFPCFNYHTITDIDTDVAGVPNCKARDLRNGTNCAFFGCVVVHGIRTNIGHTVCAITNLQCFYIQPAIALDKANTVSCAAAEPVSLNKVRVTADFIGILLQLVGI